MKKALIFCGLVAMKLALPAEAAIVLNQNWLVDTDIPEGNPVGLTEYETFTTLAPGPITDVQVNLDIAGGYNGGLYGALVFQSAAGGTSTEILLNEAGSSGANPFGSSGSGFNVTLSDSGTANGSIHNATGALPMGTWLPDSSATLDGTFGGQTANGTWTLFLADEFAGGGTSTLLSWGLEISVAAVPEAKETGALAGCGALAAAVLIFRRPGQKRAARRS